MNPGTVCGPFTSFLLFNVNDVSGRELGLCTGVKLSDTVAPNSTVGSGLSKKSVGQVN
jgi:hypothetical protein